VRSRAYFKLRGGWAVFLSRFLFSALGGVINLLAGVFSLEQALVVDNAENLLP
jgi:hypothetical protein